MPIALTDTFNPRESPACLVITGIIIVVGLVALKNPRLFLAGIMHPASIKKEGQFYRLISSDFIHNDIVHLAINSFALFAVGSQLEEYLRSAGTAGSAWFLAVYFSSCLCGNFFTYLRHRNDFEFSSAGASGSVLGCMMAFMILQPYHIAFYLPVIGGVANLYVSLIYIVFLLVYQIRTGNPLVNNEVHFYGAMGGLIAALILKF
ncbi:rhomboid family intramembrane serine protease [Mucilaginibacter aquariorum]|uniref:Rhomboid family intramembrane serine protease n=1 Tax=Mucilaginibacter aquariorum TaxID=2967225 RepID=A0ABT1SZ67_9SPHI|nr:rhomboid family intramembrane serine protease [Mucilaginibacter aquariorum]MCQ6957632.1 rhomboid family intramembrane serine protease [Mucilaginibacter aquariorum]